MRRTSLVGKRVVLTGALGGIGAASAEALRAGRAEVIGIDLGAGDGVIAADATDKEAIQGAIDEAAAVMGGIDILINNAGIGRAQDAGDFPNADVRAVIETNLFGAWNATAAALRYLLRSRGHIVNIASGLAVATVPYAAAYSASKRALAGYSDVLRMEYDRRLTVTVVHPGYIKTPIHDVAAESGASLQGLIREQSVDAAAAAIVRACTKRPREMATTRTLGVGLWFARHLPGVTSTAITRGVRRHYLANPRPTFVLEGEPEDVGVHSG
ncbi:MAG TPA: SDR family NAD(P)-dependent oxidoreductase [Actinomycetota bacterium]|nr:SDR family NAD(P)-dependent oxidoreductase [Actinomycetota bacterium]